MHIQTFILTVFTIITFFSKTTAQNYCDDPAHSVESKIIAQRIEQAFVPLGQYTGDKKNLIDTYNALPSHQKDPIRHAMEELRHYAEDTSDKINCIMEQILSPDIKNWISFIRGTQIPQTLFVSPNFKKGLDLMLELNVAGATDLFTTNERYCSSFGLMFGSTVKRSSALKSRRLRYLAGGNLFYQQTKVYGMFSGRIEWKAGDISVPPVNLGCWKLFLQGNINKNIFMLQGGAGVEFYFAGMHLLAGYQNAPGNYYIQSGIFLNLARIKTKKL